MINESVTAVPYVPCTKTINPVKFIEEQNDVITTKIMFNLL